MSVSMSMSALICSPSMSIQRCGEVTEETSTIHHYHCMEFKIHVVCRFWNF
jgi:hypothetical protein